MTTGYAVEANPLMAELLSLHPVVFYLGKLSLVLLGSILLWRLRDHLLAVTGLILLFLIYYALLLFHLGASSTLFWELVSL